MRGIAWKPTRVWIGIHRYPLYPFVKRNYRWRPFGDICLQLGLMFGVIHIWFSEAWPFIRKE